MLIVRSPLRISLAGGGTDLPVYYREYGGMVINMAIDCYFYVFLKTGSQQDIQIASADFRTYDHWNANLVDTWRGGMELPRAVFHHFGVTGGANLFLASEVPPGSGLGSSSSVAVGLIKALTTACGVSMSKEETAELACFIEIEKLGSPIGKQDQYAASYGGINLIDFGPDKTQVTPLRLSTTTLQRLAGSLILFYTGETRSANRILMQQQGATGKKEKRVLESLHRVKDLVMQVKAVLEDGNMAGLGQLLHQNWTQKKNFAQGVTNSFIDCCYDLAIRNGAWGGKITGAGGGGFLLICCPEENREAVCQVLEQKGLKRVAVAVDNSGARVLLNAGLRLTTRQNWTPPEKLRCAV